MSRRLGDRFVLLKHSSTTTGVNCESADRSAVAHHQVLFYLISEADQLPDVR